LIVDNVYRRAAAADAAMAAIKPRLTMTTFPTNGTNSNNKTVAIAEFAVNG
jgi:hypothetical protein